MTADTPDDLDVQQRAQELIATYGDAARSEAERKMTELMAADDPKSAGLWLAVMYEIHRCQPEHMGEP